MHSILSKRETFFNMRMRKKRRGSERLLQLGALFIGEEEIKAGAAECFDKKRPMRLEIGCGKGEFIRRLSRRDTDYNYIAMERVDDVIVVAAEKYAEDRGLGRLDYHGGWRAPDGMIYDGVRWDIPLADRGNVRFMNRDASLLDEYFPDGSFEAIYANFSDPWTKSGYAERRLTHPEFLKKYLRLLAPGGTFCFKTDNVELFDFSVDAIKSCEGFEVIFESRDLHQSERADTNIETEYERNFASQGIKINCIEARKIKA